MKAVFLDRDGTINLGIPKYERVDSLDKVELFPYTIQALTLLAKLDFIYFFVTNQAGIAEGKITLEDFDTINKRVLELITPSGIKILKTYLCPHSDASTCDCRKPKPTMLLDAAKEFNIDLAESYMVGDRITDVLTGINAGTKTILVQSGEEISPDFSQATFTAPTLVEAAEYIESHL